MARTDTGPPYLFCLDAVDERALREDLVDARVLLLLLLLPLALGKTRLLALLVRIEQVRVVTADFDILLHLALAAALALGHGRLLALGDGRRRLPCRRSDALLVGIQLLLLRGLLLAIVALGKLCRPRLALEGLLARPLVHRLLDHRRLSCLGSHHALCRVLLLGVQLLHLRQLLLLLLCEVCLLLLHHLLLHHLLVLLLLRLVHMLLLLLLLLRVERLLRLLLLRLRAMLRAAALALQVHGPHALDVAVRQTRKPLGGHRRPQLGKNRLRLARGDVRKRRVPLLLAVHPFGAKKVGTTRRDPGPPRVDSFKSL